MVHVCAFMLLLVGCAVAGEKSPLIIVPGIAGSQLWARGDTAGKDFQIWVSLSEIYIYNQLKELVLDYDLAQRRPIESSKFSIYAAFYGDTRGVERLDDDMTLTGNYMHELVKQICASDPYYVRNRTIRAAPYDFRFTPRESPSFVTNLKQLVEETYEMNNQTRVTLLGHSFGGPNTAIFLRAQTGSWRKKYIKQFISIAGVYAGSVKSIKSQVSGDSVYLPLVHSSTMRPLLRSMSGVSAILPHVEHFREAGPLVLTDQRNYTVLDYESLFRDVGSNTSFFMWQDNAKLYQEATSPPDDILIKCVYGKDLPTMRQLDYRSRRFPDSDPKLIYGDGDGTVNIESLQICEKWAQETRVMPKAEHFAIVFDTKLINMVHSWLVTP